jgi:hypothetical protein
VDGFLFLFTLINRLVSDSYERYFFIKSFKNAIRGQLLVLVSYLNIILTGKLSELQQRRARSTLCSPLDSMNAGKNTSFALINRNEYELALCFFVARSMSKTEGILPLKNTPGHKVYVQKSARVRGKVEIWDFHNNCLK